MNQIWKWLGPRLRGPRVSAWLSRRGIDPVRYWLLMDLFATLSERREVLNQLGRDSSTLKMASWVYFGFSGLIALPFVLTEQPPAVYFGIFMVIGAFMMLSMLLPETSNSLVNPVEGLVLAHQPIDGATYTAAKLSHIGMIVLYIAPGLSVIPAFAALFLPNCPWYYPLLHLSAAFALGIVLALACCALFGYLLRFVAPARLKSVAFAAEMAPWLFYGFAQFGNVFHMKLHVPRWLPRSGPPVAIAVGILVLLGIAAMVLGIRALSGDYLVRVSAIAHGGSGAKSKVRRSRLGAVVSLLGGGPPARAGFDYLSRMMLRDWQFRRSVMSLIPMTCVAIFAAVRNIATSPFSGKFTGIHFLPHAFGFAFFVLAGAMVYGNSYKAAWLFLLAPSGAFRGFVRGVYARLLVLLLAPHLILLPLLIWKWGARDAVLFLFYSVAAGAVYLGLELRLIEGMPFSKQPTTATNPYMIPIMMVGGMVIGVAVALQYYLLFHSPLAVLGASLVFYAAAWVITRSSLDAFEVTVRYHLGILSADVKSAFYTEVQG